MKAILALILLFVSTGIHAETLNFAVKFRGALSGFSWVTMADATISTHELASCGRSGSCLNTRVSMTSENHKLLESLYPTRFFYQSFFQQQPARTLAFEKREKKDKASYQPYGYRHKLVTISGDGMSATYRTLWSKGDPLTAEERQFVSDDIRGGKLPSVLKRTSHPIARHALDRWAMIYTARFLPYKKGFAQTVPGTNGKDKLTYKVRFEGSDKITARGKNFKAWKVSITETKAGKPQPTLYLWLSADESRLPLRIELEEDIGRVRFYLR